jgi:hypothetical protein
MTESSVRIEVEHFTRAIYHSIFKYWLYIQPLKTFTTIFHLLDMRAEWQWSLREYGES